MALTMTSSIIFGDVNAWLNLDNHQCGRATVPTLQSVLKKTADCIVVQREAASNKAFAELDKKLATSLEVKKNATVTKDAKTKLLRLRTYTAEQTSAYLKRVEKRAAKAAIPDYDSIVSNIDADRTLLCLASKFSRTSPRITIAGGPLPSETIDTEPPAWKGIHALSRKKQKSTVKNVVMNSHQLECFSKDLRKIMHDKEMSFEIVGTRCNKGKYVRHESRTYVQLETHHHKRKYLKRDIMLNAYNTLWVKFLSQVPHWKREENEMEVRPGCSGFVYNMDTFLGKPRGAKDGILIVRGLLHDRLLDARFKVHRSNIERIEHYTSVAEKFWKGFTTSYTGNRQTQDHECTSDFDVEKVGAMTALVWQIIAPSGKITCRTCARKYSEYTMEELRERIEAKYTELHAKLGNEHADLLYPVKFVADYKRMVSAMNPNYESFSQVKQLIGDRTEAPFTHVNRVNAILAKGNAATQHELSEASTALLEVARYLNNRTENIQQGSLKHFRNKVSGKSKANMKLMCDNQLDPNGNFKWGKREYHAKRFFVNYLQVVHPERGYDGFEIRKIPDGTRKLAINNLIVSTNFDNIRQQLEGESVGDMPLTDECVSRYLGQFKYPCCCVTHDDGTPQLSSVFMPIKNHLAIGNTGDSKYVDLPQAEGMEMYISKDGYCYINVFLAMLVNVNEDDAKEFTKMVRDVLIPKLGLWPSMMDLATACYYLTLFFPDTISAELPQILVDHKTKTLHVLDSYGSISTGYHILKADTIGQLNWFAHLKLDSAIKHYKVGGKLSEEQTAHTSHTETEEGLVRKLIRATYRPSELEKCLREDPYLVVMALVSPSILLKLFTSGSLEWALANIAKRDMNLVHLYVLLKVLIEKVSVAKTLEMQSAIIGNQAHAIHGAINFSDLPGTHNAIIQQFLNKLIGHDEANKELREVGFRDLHGSGREYIEKNFQQELRAAWLELTLVEKLQSIRFSQTWSTQLAKPSEREIVKDSTDKSAGSVGLSFGQIKRYTKERITRARQGVAEAIKRKRDQVNNAAWGLMVRFIPKALHIINVLLVLQIMISIAHITNRMLNEHKEHKVIVKQYHEDQQFEVLYRIFIMIEKQKGQRPTYEEYMVHLENHHPDLLPVANKYFANTEEINLQAKSTGEAHLERVVAFVALVMMMFSPDRSDGVYRILNKLRGLVRIAEEPIELQGIDDINDILTEKKQTVDFELSDVTLHETNAVDKTFQQWWDHQIAHGFTVPHYTTEGKYMEFTRNTAEKVANEIAHSSEKDFLIRGAVGSGKSTGLPFLLSKRGSVLIVEPTRPLAENVSKQLRGDPFYASPNLRMRGATAFGSSPITVMTSGYALHYLANNSDRIKDYNYFIFDECHVNDSNAMALRCLIHEYSGDHKVLKVSATPPGRMVQFETQHPVKLLEEEHLSFQQFVQNQGTGSNSDVTKHGDNILVYVASYNEVDTLSKLLLDKNHKVTKVDGRTMKVGGVEITTHGTSAKKHFVVATNIIENGVTLDIDVVVDFGVKVVPVLDSENRMIRYQKKNISYGERIQRLGRVGRNKPGTALKIGFTEKGPQEIPSMIATEAAFSCFAYGLPVMTGNVSTNLLSRCTVRQARAMMKFELSVFFMVGLVRFDGSMHAGIHDILKPFKLRESSMTLNKMAIPYGNSSQWLNARQYAHLGQHMDVAEETKIPFYVKDIPEKVYENIWQTTMKYKGEAGFGRCVSSNVSKIAYTLKTDPASIQRTVKTIDGLIAEERRKESYFQNATSQYCSFSEFSLSSITNAIKAHYSTNNTLENITILTEARDKLLHFWHSETQHAGELWKDEDAFASRIQNNGVLENIVLQGRDEIATNLKLKGKWKKSLITRDILILAGVGIGGVWMLFEQFKHKWNESIDLQGKGKRQRQKLKFRQARDMKGHFQVHADDETLSHYYGEAYTKKGKKSGKVHGMGKKNKRFVNMYERDEDDFSMIRFVDPVSGKTIDEGMYYNMDLVQQQFGDYRQKLLEAERIQSHQKAQGIAAYLIKDFSSKALKVDLTPHNPLLVSNKSNNIMGYPEREFELRQTGPAIIVDPSSIPQENPIDEDEVMDLEGAGHINALRSYEPVSSIICYLNNETNGNPYKLFGIGFGSYIITSSHLFMHNNGILKIKSKHGDFEVRNTTQLLIRPLKDRDMILIKMPKDFPPFPQRVRFRQPQAHETACLVGALFQDKSIQSTVSGQSEVVQHTNKWMWKHWISTQKGQCGLPLVSTVDGSIIGIHTASSNKYNCNYFTSIPENFEQEFLHTDAHAEWCKHWRFNADHSMWSGLDIVNCKPEPIFRPTKEVSQLDLEGLLLQGQQGSWIQEHLRGNLMAVATSPSQLVTKHVVKGKCHLFEIYLSVNPQAKEYFTPMLGCYQKSALNREAYIKDITKYAETTRIGDVDTKVFFSAVEALKRMFGDLGFQECEYVTDEEAIFGALNLKSAVGALYSGKKKDYFEGFTGEDKAKIVEASCKRLFLGKMGLWNGSMKAELRPKEKVQLNKTRTFTAAPIDTLLGGKVCVDDFNNQFYSLNIKAPWAVGMTKFYGGWNELLMALPDGWVYCDADGSRFDSSLSPFLINAVLDIRSHFMEEWDIGEQMLRNLYTEIVYTPVLTPDSTIIKKCKGNNSGQPSTVVDNTMMVILAMIYSLEKLGVPYQQQHTMIRYFVTGDDLLIAIEPKFEVLLDSFEGHFSDLGLNYEFSARSRKREDLWFMSHKGLMREGIYIPKLEPERIVSILEWDRSREPIHRLEAICASMIEAWGYDDLVDEIRKFYAWVLEQAPYNELAKEGKAPYLAETALRNLYLGKEPTEKELERYAHIFEQADWDEDTPEEIELQGDDDMEGNDGVSNAGAASTSKDKQIAKQDKAIKDLDVNVGTRGTGLIPRVKMINQKLRVPKIKGGMAMDLDFLLTYKPAQDRITNAAATDEQFEQWYEKVREEYNLDEEQMKRVVNGLMVWCIENGTSPNINGVWVMMDGDEQVPFSLKPVVEYAKPTLRQIMARYSDVAEAYIAMRNTSEKYMPRYGLIRNLRNYNLARYAFDFYQVTPHTPDLAREIHHQMKAAALRGTSNRQLGFDGKVSTTAENTERHTADDVNNNTHSFQGAGQMW